jgi:hypothetical protein
MAEKVGGYMGDPLITGEREIDIGLRKRPLREAFLHGPLFIRDIKIAARMPRKALALWLAVHYRSGLRRGEWATLPSKFLSELGIGKDARANGLRRLEHAGLIKLKRPKGYMIQAKPVQRRKRR